ncbi:unnamed protein product, partial [Amoebophrya sp. A120]
SPGSRSRSTSLDLSGSENAAVVTGDHAAFISTSQAQYHDSEFSELQTPAPPPPGAVPISPSVGLAPSPKRGQCCSPLIQQHPDASRGVLQEEAPFQQAEQPVTRGEKIDDVLATPLQQRRPCDQGTLSPHEDVHTRRVASTPQTDDVSGKEEVGPACSGIRTPLRRQSNGYSPRRLFEQPEDPRQRQEEEEGIWSGHRAAVDDSKDDDEIKDPDELWSRDIMPMVQQFRASLFQDAYGRSFQHSTQSQTYTQQAQACLMDCAEADAEKEARELASSSVEQSERHSSLLSSPVPLGEVMVAGQQGQEDELEDVKSDSSCPRELEDPYCRNLGSVARPWSEEDTCCQRDPFPQKENNPRDVSSGSSSSSSSDDCSGSDEERDLRRGRLSEREILQRRQRSGIPIRRLPDAPARSILKECTTTSPSCSFPHSTSKSTVRTIDNDSSSSRSLRRGTDHRDPALSSPRSSEDGEAVGMSLRPGRRGVAGGESAGSSACASSSRPKPVCGINGPADHDSIPSGLPGSITHDADVDSFVIDMLGEQCVAVGGEARQRRTFRNGTRSNDDAQEEKEDYIA